MDDPADFSFQRINIVVTATINPLAKTIMATVDRLLNNRIDKVFTRNWVVDGFESADFIYRLSTGKHFRFPEIYERVTDFEYCLPSDEHRPYTPSGDKLEFYDKNFFHARITDLFVPEDPELRSPDEFIVALSSGLFLFQESGAPEGLVTRCDLTTKPSLHFAMVSVFDTPEWKALKK